MSQIVLHEIKQRNENSIFIAVNLNTKVYYKKYGYLNRWVTSVLGYIVLNVYKMDLNTALKCLPWLE